jgi:hypothetical protein
LSLFPKADWPIPPKVDRSSAHDVQQGTAGYFRLTRRSSFAGSRPSSSALASLNDEATKSFGQSTHGNDFRDRA